MLKHCMLEPRTRPRRRSRVRTTLLCKKPAAPVLAHIKGAAAHPAATCAGAARPHRTWRRRAAAPRSPPRPQSGAARWTRQPPRSGWRCRGHAAGCTPARRTPPAAPPTAPSPARAQRSAHVTTRRWETPGGSAVGPRHPAARGQLCNSPKPDRATSQAHCKVQTHPDDAVSTCGCWNTWNTWMLTGAPQRKQ